MFLHGQGGNHFWQDTDKKAYDGSKSDDAKEQKLIHQRLMNVPALLAGW